jgi:hypothetical protein
LPGTLKQDDISLRLPLGAVLGRVMPLDDRIIRLLAPDSYRNLTELLLGQQSRIARARSTAGTERFSIWYATFVALEPDAQFNPGELVISGAGRDFRALEIIPLTAGFGEQRIQQGQSQAALYLYDEAVDPEQPLELSMQGVRNGAWPSILRVIERERARLGSVRTDTLAPAR